MSRRASLPGASELFRRTSSPALDQSDLAHRSLKDGSRGRPESGNGSHSGGNVDGNGHGSDNGSAGGGDSRARDQLANSAAARRGTGRQKHDAKITVYVSGDELVAMEQARLTLRASHDLAVDRGRLVREAVAVLLADFDQHGEDSVLVRRLRDGGVESQAEEATRH
ncbi:cobyrinic acid a,c-diamide synthase [Amycolatopsis palatopharyngis]|uniref:cobyrinic acid a,c-diamide synthase n=1 Tax=Amycolatopsis palatopharyngis TaxID=187982 RepID=UPI00147395EE|nr:cobyrinic acid a,c-diamide synthase [Amycolatopsis palatopharyngis]